MTIGVVGRKVGMTRVFTDEGASLPVTVIEVEPNRVAQLKTLDTDGYRAVQDGRLLVEYGYGLADQLGTLILKYQLNDRLTLESSTGTVSTIDLKYNVRRK